LAALVTGNCGANGGFRSETAIWIRFKKSVGTSTVESSTVDINIIVFQGEDDGRGYRNMYKIPKGPKPNLGH
jgi:hypothetical protein